MSELLKSYEEFESADLASQFHELVNNNARLLSERNLVGVVLRYGTALDVAEKNIIKAQNERNSRFGHYAIVGATGDVVGAASVINELPLKKLRLPMPAGLARGPLSVKYPHANPNIHAWTDAEDTESLAFAYSQLTHKIFEEKPYITFGNSLTRMIVDYPWTIEPTKSPDDIHDAITALSGLKAIVSKRFDDGESNREIPSISTLYALADTEKELKRGTISL